MMIGRGTDWQQVTETSTFQPMSFTIIIFGIIIACCHSIVDACDQKFDGLYKKIFSFLPFKCTIRPLYETESVSINKISYYLFCSLKNKCSYFNEEGNC